MVDAGKHQIGLAVSHQLADGKLDAVGGSAVDLIGSETLAAFHQMGPHGSIKGDGARLAALVNGGSGDKNVTVALGHLDERADAVIVVTIVIADEDEWFLVVHEVCFVVCGCKVTNFLWRFRRKTLTLPFEKRL